MDNQAFEKAKNGCEHDYMLDEEIGLCCRLCGHVGTEIKHVSAPFVSETHYSKTIMLPIWRFLYAFK